MKNLILTIALLCSTLTFSWGQKLVIGSTIPNFKEVKWLSQPPKEGKAFLIDFYQDSNPTCKQYFAKLAPLQSTYGDKLSIVVLTRDNNEAISSLVSKFGNRYHFGYDDDGDVFTAFGIKYLPSSLITDSKGKILWMGNLGNLPQSVLDKL